MLAQFKTYLFPSLLLLISVVRPRPADNRSVSLKWTVVAYCMEHSFIQFLYGNVGPSINLVPPRLSTQREHTYLPDLMIKQSRGMCHGELVMRGRIKSTGPGTAIRWTQVVPTVYEASNKLPRCEFVWDEGSLDVFTVPGLWPRLEQA